MTSTLLLLDLLGAAALLLWGLRLLKSGVGAALGASLRHFLAASTRNRFTALGAGMLATLALQSSTAMAIMTASFVSQGLVTPTMAQALMLGANVGTALVAVVLSWDIQWLSPVAILIGAALGSRKTRKSLGTSEVMIGFGLMLLALQLMSAATGPMRESEAVATFFSLLDEAPIIAVVLAAGLAAVSASSLAAVLFITALASVGSIDMELCLLLVAGANIGGALPPVFATAMDGATGQRVAITNVVVRGIGVMAVLASAGWFARLLPGTIGLPQLVILAHLGFNIALAVVFLPLIDPLARLVTRLLPDKPRAENTGPLHLEDSLLTDPPSALAAAMRETLHVGDLVEKMLETSLTALKTNDEMLCRSVYQFDDQVDAIHEAIKLYLARIDRGAMDEAALRQSRSILDYAINLEHAGDILERSLSRLTMKKIEKQVQYSPEGMGEIEELFEETIENLQMAQRVFINRDAHTARRLMEAKVTIRQKERQSVERHMARLHERRPDTLQTTSLHMDVLRDLKRINGHLISVAAPILKDAGLLRESRLRKG